MHTPGYVARIFEIDSQTVRNWCREYADFLSGTANPPAQAHRRFTDADLTVFALVATLRKQGMKVDEVQAALLNGQREDPPDERELAILANPNTHIALLTQRIEEMQTTISDLTDEVERLKPVESENIGLKMLIERTEKQLKEAQAENARLNREIGRLESKE